MLWVLLLCFFPDGELVLRNGKIVHYKDEYKIEGDWIRFTGKDGKFLQLPLKMVDMEKTNLRAKVKADRAAADKKAAREKAHAKREADRQEKENAPQLADLVEDSGVDRELSVDDSKVDGYVDQKEKYQRSRTRYKKRVQEYRDRYNYDRKPTEDERRNLRRYYAQRYKSLQGQIRSSRQNLVNAKASLKQLKNSSPVYTGDDYEDDRRARELQTRIAHQERYVAQLEKNIEYLEQALKKLDKEAVKAGVTGFRSN